MKKFLKSFVIILAVIFSGFAFVACGSTGNNDSAVKQENTTNGSGGSSGNGGQGQVQTSDPIHVEFGIDYDGEYVSYETYTYATRQEVADEILDMTDGAVDLAGDALFIKANECKRYVIQLSNNEQAETAKTAYLSKYASDAVYSSMTDFIAEADNVYYYENPPRRDLVISVDSGSNNELYIYVYSFDAGTVVPILSGLGE